jgi:hypothetical protein
MPVNLLCLIRHNRAAVSTAPAFSPTAALAAISPIFRLKRVFSGAYIWAKYQFIDLGARLS